MESLTRLVAVLAIAVLSACSNVPTKGNMGVAWTPVASACRAAKTPNNDCVNQDLERCVAFVDYANPGRDETNYMAIITGVATLLGTAVTYHTAGFGSKAVEAVSGTIFGSSLGTALSYNSVLYRSSVDACLYVFGQDRKLAEGYFATTKYNGGKVEQFTGKP